MRKKKTKSLLEKELEILDAQNFMALEIESHCCENDGLEKKKETFLAQHSTQGNSKSNGNSAKGKK